jgi:LCP family protein required for cell wall assembly
LIGADRLRLPEASLGESSTWLVVGNDFRGDLAKDEAVGDLEGDRADLVALIRSDIETSKALFVPRDTLVMTGGFGEVSLSLTLAYGGSPMLIDSVSDLVVRPGHYVELRLAAFPDLVDSLGGVEMTFQHEGRDATSGFNTSSGLRVLTGTEALAFVRARQYEILVDGEWMPSTNGDLDRICREQLFLGALIQGVRTESHARVALRMLVKGGLGSVSIDASTGGVALVELLRNVSGANLELLTLPVVYTVGQQSSPFGPAHVGNLPRLEKDGAKAAEVVDYFLGLGPRPSFDPGLTCSI